ncbi:MAG: pseudouridine synthase [Anaerolineae bacterium]|nr:rRNA pseudouridine synthase [Thermoflexales bacterium]MDW8395395.1 pseudouridine synthase [Anaerolineae bacterium]
MSCLSRPAPPALLIQPLARADEESCASLAVRLQQFLSRAGFGARRKCEALIAQGRVTVNGQVARLGTVVRPGDEVRLDGQLVHALQPKVYVALNKPVGYASDRSDPTAKTMFELVDLPIRLFGVGRLDKDSDGLILLTNDGDFAYRLTHPRFEHEKEYRVVVEGVPDDASLERWRRGVKLPGETRPTAPCRVEITGVARQGGQPRATLRVIMHEGRKRQIRRTAALLGYPVISLTRVRIGTVTLEGLKSGQWRYLSAAEVAQLLESASGQV